MSTSVASVLYSVLSFLTIGSCTVQKLPQIWRILIQQKITGISIRSVLIEVITYSVMTCYNFVNNYNPLSYLEYPVLAIQQIILVGLIIHYSTGTGITISHCLQFVTYLFTVYIFVAVKPVVTLNILASLCTPLSLSSKVLQLRYLLKSKQADCVSTITWLISTLTNFARVVTVAMDSLDLLLLVNFSLSTLLSGSILVTTYILQKSHRTA